MSESSMTQILKQANQAVWEQKEKQFRTLSLVLAVLVFLAVAYHFYRVLALGIGNPNELFGSALSYALILVSRLPSKILSFKSRIRAMILSGFVVSLSAILTAGTLGSGYILVVLEAFLIHYFLEKRPATILILSLLGVMAAVSLLRFLGLLPPLPLVSDALLNGYTASKVLVVTLTVAGFHFMDSRSADILKKSITDAILSREKLRAEQVATDEYLESIPGIFFLFDSNWQLSRWNRNLSRYSGYSPEELKGKNVLSFFTKDKQPRVRQKISDIFVKGSAYTEGELVSKNGTKLPFAFTGRAVEIGGRTHACGIGLELSEKRQLEREVQEAQKMEAIGTLAGGVAHDLNNILGGITGYAEIIKADIEDRSLPPVEHLDVILDSCMRGAGIVQQILMFSRRTEEKKIPLQLYSVVRDAVKLIRRTIPRSIEIKETVSRDKVAILADPNQLHQVVMNVCTNAWHAMRETGGELSVSVDTVDVTRGEIPKRYAAEPGLFQRVVIGDTGTGISEEVMTTIFEPFFTTKPVGEGTGLGLAVVDKIVRKHDGFIILNSRVNKGSEFSIYFPVFNQEAMLSTENDVDILPRGTEHVLIVDDEPTIRDASKIILEGLGYTVYTAENGEEGVALFQAHKDVIGLVITDFSMPRKNGCEMAIEILSHNPNVPILLCTGYSETLETRQISTAQFTAILHKPLQRADLARAVRNLLDGIPLIYPSITPKML